MVPEPRSNQISDISISVSTLKLQPFPFVEVINNRCLLANPNINAIMIQLWEVL